MALPPEHPLWPGLGVILLVALASALVVYFRADRIAAPEIRRAFGSAVLRRRGAVGILFSTIAIGIVTAVGYGSLSAQLPEHAARLFHVASTALAVALSAGAFWTRRGRRYAGALELVTLNFLWCIGFGWGLPLAARAWM